ncbi:MAG: hypothetical protein WCI89_02595 [bacterium]
MVTPEALAYVRAKQATGAQKEEITKSLLEVGWDVQTIGEIFSALEKEKPAEKPAVVAATSAAPVVAAAAPATSASAATASPAGAASAHIPVTPTLRALTAIDAQLRAGVDKKTIQALLLGVGWEAAAVDEALVAVEWGESLSKPGSATSALLDAHAPKLGVVEHALAQIPAVPTKRALVAIDALLHSGVSKGNIRTLLTGVGWDIRAIDEAFLAVEWRDQSTTETPATL